MILAAVRSRGIKAAAHLQLRQLDSRVSMRIDPEYLRSPPDCVAGPNRL